MVGGSWLQASLQIYILLVHQLPDSLSWRVFRFISITFSLLNLTFSIFTYKLRFILHRDPKTRELLKLAVREFPDFCIVFIFPIMAFLANQFVFGIFYTIMYFIIITLSVIMFCKRITNDQFNFHYLIYLPNAVFFLNKINKDTITHSLIVMIIYDSCVIIFHVFVFFSNSPENYFIATLILALLSLTLSILELYFRCRSKKSCLDWAFRESLDPEKRTIGRQSSRNFVFSITTQPRVDAERGLLPTLTKCNKNGCSTCPLLVTDTSTTASTNSPSISVPLNFVASCDTTSVIYCITCSKCRIQYIGETGRKLKERISEHLGYTKLKNTNHSTGVHFKKQGHVMKVSVLEVFGPNDRATRQKKEQFYINIFDTLNNGLNQRF